MAIRISKIGHGNFTRFRFGDTVLHLLRSSCRRAKTDFCMLAVLGVLQTFVHADLATERHASILARATVRVDIAVLTSLAAEPERYVTEPVRPLVKPDAVTLAVLAVFQTFVHADLAAGRSVSFAVLGSAAAKPQRNVCVAILAVLLRREPDLDLEI